MNWQRHKRPERRGILLLIVLSMLAFLSILVVTYVAFSSRSRRNAYALASRQFRAIQHDKIIDDAMMTLLRGPRDNVGGSNNTRNPFFGEDLLADIYGVTDHTTTSAIRTSPTEMVDHNGDTTPMRRPMHLDNYFVRIPLDESSLTTPKTSSNSQNGNPVYHLDDALAGRLLTMLQGPLKGQSFRILRSTGNRDSGSVSNAVQAHQYLTKHSVVIELDPNMMVTLGTGQRLRISDVLSSSQRFNVSTLFYAPGFGGAWGRPNDNDDNAGGTDDYAEAAYPNSDDTPYEMLINGTPMNGGGVGYNGTNVDDTFPSPPGSSFTPPVAFQPNVKYGHDTTVQDKSLYSGDADEPYDAADFQNWFLAHRYIDENGNTRITPSFHRPALINYLVNQFDLSSVSPGDLRALVAAIRRASLRPLPFTANQPHAAFSLPHYRFTGSSAAPALRAPNYIADPSSNAHMLRLSNLVDALVNGPWDVDNDGDSVPDSVWVDLGLPPVTSPEGKVLKPLIAPLIEDLGGRINLNAHGNVAQLEPQPSNTTVPQYATNQPGPWGGTTTTNEARVVFRGLGYGPAEIALPGDRLLSTSAAGAVHEDAQLFETADRLALLKQRYANPSTGSLPDTPAPGWDGGNPTANRNGGDDLDNLLHGVRPGVHTLQRLAQAGTNTLSGGWGMSIDPWGRGGLGVHRTGQLFASVSGTVVEPYNAGATPDQPLLNESFNDPYEMDPTGRLGGDSPYTWAELEALLRNNPWASDELPARLRSLLSSSASAHPELARMVTARSVALDLPTSMMPVGNRQNRSVPLSAVILARLGVDVSLSANPTNAELIAFRNRMTTANAQYQALIAPELRLGNKMDINRPFGNGVDDRGTPGIDDDGDGTTDEADERNGVIDEPLEGLAETVENLPLEAFPAAGTTSSYVSTAFSDETPDYRADQPPKAVNNNSPVAPFDPGGRQLFARNLYILMMAMTGQGYDFPLETNDVGTVSVPPDDYKARRLAQWAVNVADYRDHDSIMTAFEYDTDLTDGSWDVNGDLADNAGESGHRDVVWGVENPELVFSESLALHDVRVRDSENETAGGTGESKTAGMNPDEDTDSIRMPQGSLFLELYNPRPRVNSDENHLPGVPHELYSLSGGQYQLDLARVAPGGGAVPVPVWRVAISEPHYEGASSQTEYLDPENLRQELPDTASFEPKGYDELGIQSPSFPGGGAPTELQLQRFVFFTPLESTDDGFGDGVSSLNEIASVLPDVQTHEIFYSIPDPIDPPYSSGVDRLLEPSQYLLLAPRVTTHLGSMTYAGPSEPTGPSNQRFQVFTPDNPWSDGTNSIVGLAHYDTGNTVTTRNTNIQSRPALPLIIATPRPGGWSAGTALEGGYVGLNVSEPMPNGATGYYPEPTHQLASSSLPAEFPLTDAYVDYDDVNNTAARDVPVDMEDPNHPIRKLTEDKLGAGTKDPFLGTAPRYCSVFLQRLADPTRPFHEVTNPYRTVDWVSVDLTIFSGEDDPSNVENAPSPGYVTQSRQRNGETAVSGQTGALFSYETNDIAGVLGPLAPVGAHYFQEDFGNSFNHLNTAFGSFIADASAEDRGQPTTPFAMHPWLNRPYATVHELMMVPATSQGRLFEEFTLADTSVSPYDPATNDSDYPIFRAPFGHLLNFFHSSEAEADSAHFYRIFEFVGTKPPFKGEVELINPARVEYTAGGTTFPEVSKELFANIFQPPFNQRWDGRREGEINLNTVPGYPVWMGLMYGHLTSTERGNAPGLLTGDLNYRTFMAQRRGYPVPVPSPTGNALKSEIVEDGTVQAPPYNYDNGRFNSASPTEYAGAWRTSLDADLAPTLHGNGGPPDALRKPGVEPTLARPDIVATSMMEEDHPDYVRPSTTDTWRNTERSAAMRYQTLMRMPNLTTNQSHIFLVRLTVGYFEVDPVDGLGREYKADLGQQERYKATFIIDRSIPVGYEPGSETNVRNTILFSRLEK